MLGFLVLNMAFAAQAVAAEPKLTWPLEALRLLDVGRPDDWVETRLVEALKAPDDAITNAQARLETAQAYSSERIAPLMTRIADIDKEIHRLESEVVETERFLAARIRRRPGGFYQIRSDYYEARRAEKKLAWLDREILRDKEQVRELEQRVRALEAPVHELRAELDAAIQTRDAALAATERDLLESAGLSAEADQLLSRLGRDLRALGGMMRLLLRRLEKTLADPPGTDHGPRSPKHLLRSMLILHVAALQVLAGPDVVIEQQQCAERSRSKHWFLRWLPRRGSPTGSEKAAARYHAEFGSKLENARTLDEVNAILLSLMRRHGVARCSRLLTEPNGRNAK